MSKMSFAISLVGLVFLLKTATLACTCIEPVGPLDVRVKRWSSQATAVFTGEVSRLETSRGNSNVRVTFSVDRFWVGGASTLELITSRLQGGCGYEFRIGMEYLVYAAGPPGALRTDACSGTIFRLSPSVDDQIAILGPGILPERQQIDKTAEYLFWDPLHMMY